MSLLCLLCNTQLAMSYRSEDMTESPGEDNRIPRAYTKHKSSSPLGDEQNIRIPDRIKSKSQNDWLILVLDFRLCDLPGKCAPEKPKGWF